MSDWFSDLFGFTEVRLGVSPAMISVVCLPKLSRADATELFLGGERVSAARAADAGLVNHAVPREELDAKVDEIIGKLARGGPNALAATKQLVARVPQMDRAAAFVQGPVLLLAEVALRWLMSRCYGL